MNDAKVLKAIEAIIDEIGCIRAGLNALEELGVCGSRRNVERLVDGLLSLRIYDKYLEALQDQAYEIINDAKRGNAE